MISEDIEELVEDNNGKSLLLKKYYPEHKLYAYVYAVDPDRFPSEVGAGYGFIKESAIVWKK